MSEIRQKIKPYQAKADEDWRTRARKQIEIERASLAAFKRVYIAPDTREEMIAFIEKSGAMIFDYNYHNAPDNELVDLCCEIAWMKSRDNQD